MKDGDQMMSAYNHSEGELLPVSWRWPAAEANMSAASMTRARDFCARMLRGEIFPSVNAVLGRDGRFCVIDGCHRLCGSLLAGFLWLPVRIISETPFHPSIRRDGVWV
jgi:hypothetical protein